VKKLFAISNYSCGNYSIPEILNGAGAIFPVLVYAKWAVHIIKKQVCKLTICSFCSGGGIKQINLDILDFGATDDR
jgi:phosphate transport system substrate-binding protein